MTKSRATGRNPEPRPDECPRTSGGSGAVFSPSSPTAGTRSISLETTSEAETLALGRRLAALLQAGDTVLCSGELGAGKTVFIRGVCAGLGCDPRDVRSPSYTLVNEYRGRSLVRHADLYRLHGAAEIAGIGLDDVLDGAAVVLIEWAERLEGEPADALKVTLTYLGDDRRQIRLDGPARLVPER